MPHANEHETLHLNDLPQGEGMDLDAIAADLYTVSRMIERVNAGEAEMTDDLSTIVADLAAQVETWHETVKD